MRPDEQRRLLQEALDSMDKAMGHLLLAQENAHRLGADDIDAVLGKVVELLKEHRRKSQQKRGLRLVKA